ncbi:MAG: serine hydrolase [Phycisphaeraceae bacterium]
MTSTADDVKTVDRPWLRLPTMEHAPRLIDSGIALDGLFDLPDGSALTLARIDPQTGDLLCARWNNTGSLGFYPASTIKWNTAFLALGVMREHDLSLDHVIQVGDDPPRSLRDLIAGMLVMSDNQAFNALQETVGFRETYDWMRSIGCADSLVRRHFTRPHWNHSRAVRVWSPQGAELRPIAARPAVDMPLNGDPAPGSPRESNWFTTDDLIRCGAATLMQAGRGDPGFVFVTDQLAYTNQCYVREGLWRVTAALPSRPGYVSLNKPGWWPPDGANSELCYVYDVQRGGHYLLAVYVQGTNEDARVAMGDAAQAIFTAIAQGGLALRLGSE